MIMKEIKGLKGVLCFVLMEYFALFFHFQE